MFIVYINVSIEHIVAVASDPFDPVHFTNSMVSFLNAKWYHIWLALAADLLDGLERKTLACFHFRFDHHTVTKIDCHNADRSGLNKTICPCIRNKSKL
jgi:hypothetical protein